MPRDARGDGAHTQPVYCAPTSGGKSLVSDLLVVRRLIAGGCDGGRLAMALMVLPFVSALCQERSTELTRMLKPLGIEVRSCFGGQRGALPPRGGAGGSHRRHPRRRLTICVTRLARRIGFTAAGVRGGGQLHGQDVSRGSTVELMLTKLMHAAAEESSSDGGDASSYEYSGSHLEVGARGGASKGEDDGKPRENDINLAESAERRELRTGPHGIRPVAAASHRHERDAAQPGRAGPMARRRGAVRD